jgi:hypoxanthine phosphoribosyltransferase
VTQGGTGAVAEVLISVAQLELRVRELGAEITEDHRDGDSPPVLVSVLKGSTFFLADLVRALDIDLEVDFMSISSYTATAQQSGVVRIIKDLEGDIGGRDVVIVEDIVDTGLTLTYLRKALTERAPRSLKTLGLLDKRARRIVPVPIEYVGFEIPDVFVVGYGMDFMGRYRNVPEILAVRDLPRLANAPDLLVDTVFASPFPARAGE